MARDTVQFDVTINATLEVDQAQFYTDVQEVMYWDDTDRTEDEKHDAALEEVMECYQSDLEGQEISSVNNGRAWVCSAEIGEVI